MSRHDVIVIGAGAGGCAAALQGVELGLDVLLVDTEARRTGIRSNPLSATILRETALQRVPVPANGGIAPSSTLEGRLSLGEFAKRDEALARSHRATLRRRLARGGAQIVSARASFLSPHEIQLGAGHVHEAGAFLIATASLPRRPSRFPFDDRVVCDADSILRMPDVPRSLVVVGAEVIGCELACLFAFLGANVTLIDRRARLLRFVDRDLLRILHERMQHLGIDVVLEEDVAEVDLQGGPGAPHAVVRLASGRVEACERLLVAAGRVPDLAGLHLDRAQVEVNPQGFVQIDDCFRTTQPHVYAVGDAVESPTHPGTCMHQGRLAMLQAAGAPPPETPDPPIAIHTIPEVALIGLTEEMCQHLDVESVVGVARYADLVKAQIRRDPHGLLKLVFRRQDRQLAGVHVIGEDAGEVIHLGAALLQLGASVDQIANLVFDHPSFSEAYRVAALHALTRF